MYISVITWFFFYDLEHVDIVDHYYCDLVFLFFSVGIPSSQTLLRCLKQTRSIFLESLKNRKS